MNDILDRLYEIIVGPAKDKLKTDLLDGMDKCARVLIVTRKLAEELNIFDGQTYTDILNQYADKHYKATRHMDAEDLLLYLSEGVEKHDS